MTKEMIEFIQFDSFIVKKSEIIYAQKLEDNSIELIVKQGDETRSFAMNYDSAHGRDESFSKLTVDTNAWTIDYNWKHPLISQVHYMKEKLREFGSETRLMRKELEGMRKELRKARLLQPEPTDEEEP